MVGVELESEGGGGGAGERLEGADGLAALGEQGEARVPEIVESDSRETGPLEERLIEAVDDVLSVERENEPVILPFRARP